MFEIFCFIAGLIVGWNFLKQPEWVANMLEKVKGYFSA